MWFARYLSFLKRDCVYLFDDLIWLKDSITSTPIDPCEKQGQMVSIVMFVGRKKKEINSPKLSSIQLGFLVFLWRNDSYNNVTRFPKLWEGSILKTWGKNKKSWERLSLLPSTNQGKIVQVHKAKLNIISGQKHSWKSEMQRFKFAGRKGNVFYSFKTISKPKVHSQITYNSNMVTELKLSDMTHSFDFKINVYFSLMKELEGKGQ